MTKRCRRGGDKGKSIYLGTVVKRIKLYNELIANVI